MRRSAGQAATYKVEPYVVAADVYAVAPHTGRGGWTWYTGSAGWMYRLIVESLLGLKLDGGNLHLTPCLPADWKGFTVHYRHRDTTHHIVVSRKPGDQARATPALAVRHSAAERRRRAHHRGRRVGPQSRRRRRWCYAPREKLPWPRKLHPRRDRRRSPTGSDNGSSRPGNGSTRTTTSRRSSRKANSRPCGSRSRRRSRACFTPS